MTDAPLTVGQTVARARADAGMTVAQVAESTRIRATVVSAIENDDFRLCGGDVYARGHLKSIAAAVGADPAALVARFDEQRGAAVRASAVDVAPIEQPTRVMDAASGVGGLGALAGTLGASLTGGRRGPNWSAVMALALAVIVGVAGFSYLTNRSTASTLAGSPTSTPSGAASPTVSPSASATTPTKKPTPSSSPTDVVAQADGVLVRLTVTGRASWVRATTGPGGTTLFEGTLNKGDTKTFRDKKKIKLIIGNAGAVSLKVNGRDLGQPGSGGQVVNVTFGPGDPTTQAG